MPHDKPTPRTQKMLNIFVHQQYHTITHHDIMQLLQNLTDCDIDVIKTKNPCTFDGAAGFAQGQGQGQGQGQ